MPSTDSDVQADPAVVFEELTGRRPERVDRVLGGGNNQLYCVVEPGGEPSALKMYRSRKEDPRPRREQEFEALAFLGRIEGAPVPAAKASSERHNAAVYGWIEGVRPADADDRDIDAVLGFVELLKSASVHPDARALRKAAEACFATDDILAQIGRRRARLAEVLEAEPALREFLVDEVDPAIVRLSGRVGSAGAGVERCLSPSDFGFHNAIRRPEGTLTFVDMEYFGWDDPVKLAADFVLHPGMNLDRALAQRFLAGWIAMFGGEDGEAAARLRIQLPLYAVRWTMILLNEFLPERWQAKVFSGEAESWEAARARQLAKARIMMSFAADTAPDALLVGAKRAAR